MSLWDFMGFHGKIWGVFVFFLGFHGISMGFPWDFFIYTRETGRFGMKIRIMSDLHLEFAPLFLESVGEDILILSGDIFISNLGIEVSKSYAKKLNVPVLYIAGNHEYYRTKHRGAISLREHRGAISHTWENLSNLMWESGAKKDNIRKGNVSFFDDTCIIYKGIRFIGSTLWTDMELFGYSYAVERIVQKSINDYRFIWSDYNHLLTIDMVKTRHKKSLDFIKNKLNENFDGKTVIFTHHTPSWLSVPEEFRSDMVSAAYSSRLEDLILEKKPNIWIHGHTHNKFDYYIGDTRVICNPRGYHGYEDTGFDPNFVIDI
jgi:Icc-related predicted phosphoesterase